MFKSVWVLKVRQIVLDLIVAGDSVLFDPAVPENSFSNTTSGPLTLQILITFIGNCDVDSLKAGSHRSRQRYSSVAVTSNVKVFTQKILAVTEVIFLISSVLR